MKNFTPYNQINSILNTILEDLQCDYTVDHIVLDVIKTSLNVGLIDQDQAIFIIINFNQDLDEILKNIGYSVPDELFGYKSIKDFKNFQEVVGFVSFLAEYNFG